MSYCSISTDDWKKIYQDVDWIVNATQTSYKEVKNDQSNMFQLNSSDIYYINAVCGELKHYRIKVVSNPYNRIIGVKRD